MDRSPDMTSEQQNALVARAKAGEHFAIDRLLLFHSKALVARIEQRLPATLKSVVSAEDILQDTFAEAFRGIAGFVAQDETSFFRWLATIAEHRTLDAIRMHKAAKRGGGRMPRGEFAEIEGSDVIALLELVAIHERTPSYSAATHEAVAAVRSAIHTLKPSYRDAVTFRYIDGLSVAKTAVRMDRTERSIHKLCGRAVNCLREVLGDEGRFFSST